MLSTHVWCLLNILRVHLRYFKPEWGVENLIYYLTVPSRASATPGGSVSGRFCVSKRYRRELLVILLPLFAVVCRCLPLLAVACRCLPLLAVACRCLPLFAVAQMFKVPRICSQCFAPISISIHWFAQMFKVPLICSHCFAPISIIKHPMICTDVQSPSYMFALFRTDLHN